MLEYTHVHKKGMIGAAVHVLRTWPVLRREKVITCGGIR